MKMDDHSSDRRARAFPCVSCAGCGQPFTPTHWRSKHCRPSCRLRALKRRQQRSLFDDEPDAYDLFRQPFE